VHDLFIDIACTEAIDRSAENRIRSRGRGRGTGRIDPPIGSVTLFAFYARSSE
jgi:hypothetical protein